MAVISFADLPDTARVWIYGAEQPLTPDQVAKLQDQMAQFLTEWRSHKREVTPAWELVHDQFVLIGVDESAVGLSGCSIDSMTRGLRDFEKLSGVNFLQSGSRIFYRDAGGAICCVERPAFAALAASGAVDEGTTVFNNTIATAGAYRRGQWEVPMRDSWHMQEFGASLTPSS